MDRDTQISNRKLALATAEQLGILVNIGLSLTEIKQFALMEVNLQT
jgi:hypothetical protein